MLHCIIKNFILVLQLAQVLCVLVDQYAKYAMKLEQNIVNIHVLSIMEDVLTIQHVQNYQLHVLLINAVHLKFTVKVRSIKTYRVPFTTIITVNNYV